MKKIWAWVKARAKEVSTYLGVGVLTGISQTLQPFGGQDKTLLYISAVCGVLGVIMSEHKKATTNA